MEHYEPLQDCADGTERRKWIGVDDRGLELEIVGVVLDDGTLLIIHVMPTSFRRPS